MISRTSALGGTLCLRCQARILRPWSRRASALPAASLPLPVSRQARRPRFSCRSYSQTPSVHDGNVPPAQQPPSATSRLAYAPEEDDDSFLPDAAPSPDVEQLWNSLLQESTGPTDSEVFAHIDELRPVDDSIVPTSEFQRRLRELTDGFTTAQLQRYIHDKQTAKPFYSSSSSSSYPWILRRWAWFPDATALAAAAGAREARRQRRSPNANAAATAAAVGDMALTPKEALAVELMHTCWRLNSHELVYDMPGSLEVAVRPLEFALMSVGAGWLREIVTRAEAGAGTGIGPGAGPTGAGKSRKVRIELLPRKRQQQHVLRILAPAATADTVLAEIHTVLARATTRRFPLSEVMPGRLPGPSSAAHHIHRSSPDARIWKALSELTGSWVRPERPRSQNTDVLVSWIGKEEEAVQTLASPSPEAADAREGGRRPEDPADVAYRLLRCAYAPDSTTRVTDFLDIDPGPHGLSTSRFLVPASGTGADAGFNPGTQSDSGSPTALSKTGFGFLSISSSPSHPQKTSGFRSASRSTGMVSPNHEDPRPWQHRHDGTTWARLVLPVTSIPSLARRQKDEAPPPLELPFALPLTLSRDPTAATTTTTVATFGHLLHSDVVPSPDCRLYRPGPRLQSPEALAPLRRLLAPVVPPLFGGGGGLKMGAGLFAEPHLSTTVMLQFLPLPREAGPVLEVHLEVAAEKAGAAVGTVGQAGQAGVPRLTAVYALLQHHTADNLFPAEAVDVRVVQKRLVVVGAGPTDEAGLQPLHAFLAQSRWQTTANMGGTLSGTFSTPPRLFGLVLPAAASPGAHTHTAPRNYVLAGLEVRRRAAVPLEGWTLSLTRVEAGWGRGPHTELSLEAVPWEPAEAANVASKAAPGPDTFRRAVTRVVQGNSIKWQGLRRERAD